MDSRLGIWAIDSGASHNYCNDFTEFKKDSITEANMIIKLGDKNEVHTREKGTLQLNRVCIEAFYVPEFRISLLSVSQLDSHVSQQYSRTKHAQLSTTSATTLSVLPSIVAYTFSHD